MSQETKINLCKKKKKQACITGMFWKRNEDIDTCQEQDRCISLEHLKGIKIQQGRENLKQKV